jgi:hypothetical protein
MTWVEASGVRSGAKSCRGVTEIEAVLAADTNFN